MNELEFAKKLIAIPSFVDGKTNEEQAQNFLFDYLSSFKRFEVKKEQVEGKRYNLIVSNCLNPKLLIAGHIDTVVPGTGWKQNPFVPTVSKDKLFGLGASDMKGSLSAFLTALKETAKPRDFMLLIYVDEEYQFKGIKKFAGEYKKRIKPEFILSIDGNGPDIGFACRGCLEIKFRVLGKTGHSANPANGLNAIRISEKAFSVLENRLAVLKDELGITTLNLANIKGGNLSGINRGKIVYGTSINKIADICEFTLEVRTNSKVDQPQLIIKMVRDEIKKLGGRLIRSEITLNEGYWKTKKSELTWLFNLASERFKNVKFTNPATRGYLDTQILWQVFNKVPSASLGVGPSGNAHKANEWVSILGLSKTKELYKDILQA